MFRIISGLSEARGWAKHDHWEVDVVWVTVHKLSNLGRTLRQEFLLSAGTMIYRAFLESVQLVNPTIFWDEGNEVRVAFRLNVWNALIDSLLVLVEDFFAVLENFSPTLWVFIQWFLTEFIQERARIHDVGISLFGVNDNVKESNRTTCIDCFLFHVEDVVGNLFRFEIATLSCFEGVLSRCLLVKHQNAQDRFWDHF